MDEIGASNTWRWYGHVPVCRDADGAIVQLKLGRRWTLGRRMFISVRYGAICCAQRQNGAINNLSVEFIRQAQTPNRSATYSWFYELVLNTDKKLYASAPATAFKRRG